MPEDGVRDLQEAVHLLNTRLVEVELGDNVMRLTLVFDGVGKPTLSPGRDLFHLAPIGLDQLVDLLDLQLDRIVIKAQA